MTNRQLSIFNQLRPLSIGFNNVFDHFESMLNDDFGLRVPSINYPPYNIVETSKNKYDIEVALAGYNKKDIDVSYRPSTDTGGKPHLYMGVTIPQTKESPKGVMLNIGFFNKEGKGIVKYDNYSQDKVATSKEFEDKLIPAFKKAAALALGKIVKDPNQLNQSTVGSGYKYEEKDQADLDNYVSELPNVPLMKESLDQLDEIVDKVLEKIRNRK